MKKIVLTLLFTLIVFSTYVMGCQHSRQSVFKSNPQHKTITIFDKTYQVPLDCPDLKEWEVIARSHVRMFLDPQLGEIVGMVVTLGNPFGENDIVGLFVLLPDDKEPRVMIIIYTSNGKNMGVTDRDGDGIFNYEMLPSDRSI